MYNIKTIVISLLTSMLLTQSIFAQSAIYLENKGYDFRGAYTLGFEFHTEHAITVNQLGVIDKNNNGELDGSTPPIVGLWDTSGELLVSIEIPLETPLSTQGFYIPIEPLILEKGTYVIGLLSKHDSEYTGYYATYENAFPVEFVRGRYIGSSQLSFPRHFYNAPAFFGPNFLFSLNMPATVPMKLTSPKSPSLYQRQADKTAFIPIQGTASVATRVEARVLISKGSKGEDTPWEVIDQDIIDGEFNGTIKAKNGWYRLEVRAYHNEYLISENSVEDVGIGDIFIAAGQSNSANWGQERTQPDDERVLSLNLKGIWEVANDPQPRANANGGSPWPAMGSALVKKLDIPIGIVSTGIGATSVTQWKNYLYKQQLKPAIEDLKPYGFKAILWHQGEADSAAGTSLETYASNLENVIQNSRLDSNFNVPWGVALASRYNVSSCNEKIIVEAQESVIAEDENIFVGSKTNKYYSLGLLYDRVHFSKEGLIAHGKEWANAILDGFRLNNLAYNKPTQQSSLFDHGFSHLAVDGNIHGNYLANEATHTNEEENSWWQVDLLQSYALDTLSIWNRTECCSEDLSEYYILISDSDMKDKSYNELIQDTSIWKYYVAGKSVQHLKINPNIKGRYIRIQKSTFGHLSIAEVVVLPKEEDTTIQDNN